MSGKEKLALALEYADHKYNCPVLQVQWHKGPCDCGWDEAKESIEEKDKPEITDRRGLIAAQKAR